MNKFFKNAFLISLCFILFASCGNKKELSSVNEYGFYTNVELAEKTAKAENKELIVIVTLDGDDEYSSLFLEVAKSEDFRSKITNNFVVLNLDFSKKSYEQTVVKATESKAAQKEAEKKAVEMQENTQFAKLLNVQNTPAFYRLTKDEYFVAKFDTYYVPSSADQFIELLLACNEDAETIKKLSAKCKTGSAADRLQAINELYEFTDYNYRVFLADLIESYIKLDKDNTTGLLGKYLFADAENSALNFFVADDVLSAVKEYEKVANNPKLDPDNRQKAFFMAAMFMSASNTPDFSATIQYLNYALQAAPEGPYVETINSFLAVYEQVGQ